MILLKIFISKILPLIILFTLIYYFYKKKKYQIKSIIETIRINTFLRNKLFKFLINIIFKIIGRRL